MRIRILSDLHLEFEHFDPPAASADVVVLAGDIGNGVQGIEWAAARFPAQPVIYVAGNHEYYDGNVAEVDAALAAAARRHGIHYLDRAEFEFQGVRFLGATLWTDFDLYGPGQRLEAYEQARRHLADFRLIRTDAGPFSPFNARACHDRDREWLGAVLATSDPERTVVVTHHLPSPDSIAPRWVGSPLNVGFASDLRDFLGRARLWIHGHTHDSIDYRDAGSGCRVVCNPKGYYDENKAFRADFVCDL